MTTLHSFVVAMTAATVALATPSCVDTARAPARDKQPERDESKAAADSMGWLTVTTRPEKADAKVFVDGAYVGQAPVRTQLQTGTRLVVVQLGSRNLGPFSVQVGPGETAHEVAITTAPVAAPTPEAKPTRFGRKSTMRLKIKAANRRLTQCIPDEWVESDFSRIQVRLEFNAKGRLLAATVLSPRSTPSTDRCFTSALDEPFNANLQGVGTNTVDPERTREITVGLRQE